MAGLVVTVGVFDCFHEGHTNLLEQMRLEGDSTLVFVHDDLSTYQNKGRFPIQTLHQRITNLWRTGLADGVVEVRHPDPSETLMSTLDGITPFIYMRGDDWWDFPGRATVEELGGMVKLISYTTGISTTERRLRL